LRVGKESRTSSLDSPRARAEMFYCAAQLSTGFFVKFAMPPSTWCHWKKRKKTARKI